MMERKSPRKFKRIVALSDLHCGSRAGLTPPQWQLNPENEYDSKWAVFQKNYFDWYKQTITRLQPIDSLFVLGDCVEGKGERAEGRDVIRPHRKEQVEMAQECLLLAKANKIEMVYGTRYHVRDWEDDVAVGIGAKIGSQGRPAVEVANGPPLVFSLRHKVAGSNVPHGRATPVLRAVLWDELWSAHGLRDMAHVYLRGHVHYHQAITLPRYDRYKRWVMTLPALQGFGSEFGSEQCEGLVDFGLVYFDVYPDGRYDWDSVLLEAAWLKTPTSKH